MMTVKPEKIYDEIYERCSRHGFVGHDPFDGLNSRIFQALPFKGVRLARLAWLQAIKRSPVDLRGVLLVTKGVNPKTLALFALAELSRYRTTGIDKHADNARDLLTKLETHAITDVRGDERATAFGYNFDWQSRQFYAPQGTPAVVPTAFAGQAFAEAYDALGDEAYREKVVEVARFVATRLNRTTDEDRNICFSYTPIDRTQIFNASLLAAECLSRAYKLTASAEYAELAMSAARFGINIQRNDGAWAYGTRSEQAWADNFHTSYMLTSLDRLGKIFHELRPEADAAIEKGIAYWTEKFFGDDGLPKYYDRETYPIDIHSAAAAVSGLSELSPRWPELATLAEKVLRWTLENMKGPSGFYYQLRPRPVKTSFMRWGEAWMAYAVASYLEAVTVTTKER